MNCGECWGLGRAMCAMATAAPRTATRTPGTASNVKRARAVGCARNATAAEPPCPGHADRAVAVGNVNDTGKESKCWRRTGRVGVGYRRGWVGWSAGWSGSAAPGPAAPPGEGRWSDRAGVAGRGRRGPAPGPGRDPQGGVTRDQADQGGDSTAGPGASTTSSGWPCRPSGDALAAGRAARREAPRSPPTNTGTTAAAANRASNGRQGRLPGRRPPRRSCGRRRRRRTTRCGSWPPPRNGGKPT